MHCSGNYTSFIFSDLEKVAVKHEPDEIDILMDKVRKSQEKLEYQEMMAIRIPTIRARYEVQIVGIA